MRNTPISDLAATHAAFSRTFADHYLMADQCGWKDAEESARQRQAVTRRRTAERTAAGGCFGTAIRLLQEGV